MIKILSIATDKVIKSDFMIAETTYRVAIEKLFPLINSLDIQRKVQRVNFYKRLEIDILDGCIMPPITIAFIDSVQSGKRTCSDLERYVNKNISSGFVLDGIQRLNTLSRVAGSKRLNTAAPLFLNIIICPSKDNLLYRMVTLNNGQKPMSARHQIEMLASDIYDFEALGIDVITEKEDSTGPRGMPVFKKADIITAYIGFLSDSVSLENSKIIQEKMDELIARRIMDSSLSVNSVEFSDVVQLVSRFSKSKSGFSWLKNLNNLIGFCVGVRRSYSDVKSVSAGEFDIATKKFEEAFSHLDVSKIKLSRERRKLSEHFIESFLAFASMDADDILMEFNELE